MSDVAEPSLFVRVPTPIWLGALIVLALALDYALEPPPVLRQRAAGIALIVVGLAFSLAAALTFRRLGAEIVPAAQRHRLIVATGPFRLTRNPMYLGTVVIAIGAALVAGTWPMWLVPPVLFAIDHFAIIPFEERSMERAHGDAYRDYKSRVRRWI